MDDGGTGSGEVDGLTRREFIRITAAGGAAVVLSSAVGAPPARAADDHLRVYVLVADGMRPDEITSLTTPTLRSLQLAGTTYPQARSLPVMETIPNHVMMMTGVRPDRSGVPANAVFDPAEGMVRNLDRATDLRFTTVIERLGETGRITGTVLSKAYLFGIFGTRATHRWEPFPLIPVTEHAPDAATMDATIAMIDQFDPHLLFVNLGDVDRVGHSDVTGPLGVQAARRASLTTQDAQVARLVTHLQSTGRWGSSVLVVLADHSMDWSIPTQVISIDQILAVRPDLRAAVQIGQNGGADLVYWVAGTAGRRIGLAEIRRLVQQHTGVLSVQQPRELRLGSEAGDLVAFCRPGWRFSDPAITSNPIPGNHGHPATEPIPFFVAGGHPAVKQGIVAQAQARTVDVAPTVGALFGLRAPRGGYDGAVRRDGFRSMPLG